MISTTFLIMSHLFLYGTANNITNDLESITENLLENCLLKIVPDYTTSVTFIAAKNLNREEFPQFLKIPKISVDINYNIQFKLISTNTYVVYVQENSTIELRDIIDKLITLRKLWDLSSGPRTKMVVIYLKNCKNIVGNIYKTLWDYDITDAHVICKVENVYMVYYASPFDSCSACGKKAVPNLIGSCSDSFSSKFVHHDLRNCRFVSGLLNVMFMNPYIMDVHSKKPGLFVIPLQMIAERYHLEMEYFNVSEKLQHEFFETTLQIGKVIVNKSVDAVVSFHLREFK